MAEKLIDVNSAEKGLVGTTEDGEKVNLSVPEIRLYQRKMFKVNKSNEIIFNDIRQLLMDELTNDDTYIQFGDCRGSDRLNSRNYIYADVFLPYILFKLRK